MQPNGGASYCIFPSLRPVLPLNLVVLAVTIRLTGRASYEAIMRGFAFLIILCLVFPGCSESPTVFTTEEVRERFIDHQGKVIEVRGQLSDVFHSWLTPFGWKTAILGPPNACVICNFPPKSYDERLALGQEVVVRGVCSDEIGGCPVLSDCTVVCYEGRPGIWFWIATSALGFGLMVTLCFLVRYFFRNHSSPP